RIPYPIFLVPAADLLRHPATRPGRARRTTSVAPCQPILSRGRGHFLRRHRRTDADAASPHGRDDPPGAQRGVWLSLLVRKGIPPRGVVVLPPHGRYDPGRPRGPIPPL